MVKYNQSLPYDRIFWSQDIAGSIAFARANRKGGLLTSEEFSEIDRGFRQISEEWQTNSFTVKEGDEDIHTANERRLSEIIGKETGGKLHTGRSRNEQIATDMRLWLRDELRKLETYLSDLLKVTIVRAEKEIEYIVRDILSTRTFARQVGNGDNRCPAIPISRKLSQSDGVNGSSPTPRPLLPNSSVFAR